jgi:hypothetical protein
LQIRADERHFYALICICTHQAMQINGLQHLSCGPGNIFMVQRRRESGKKSHRNVLNSEFPAPSPQHLRCKKIIFDILLTGRAREREKMLRRCEKRKEDAHIVCDERTRRTKGKTLQRVCIVVGLHANYSLWETDCAPNACNRQR